MNSIDLHRVHDLLVTAGDDDHLHVYDTAEGRHLATIPSLKYGCQNVVWTHSPEKVVFASNKVGRIFFPAVVHPASNKLGPAGCSSDQRQEQLQPWFSLWRRGKNHSGRQCRCCCSCRIRHITAEGAGAGAGAGAALAGNNRCDSFWHACMC